MFQNTEEAWVTAGCNLFAGNTAATAQLQGVLTRSLPLTAYAEIASSTAYALYQYMWYHLPPASLLCVSLSCEIPIRSACCRAVVAGTPSAASCTARFRRGATSTAGYTSKRCFCSAGVSR